MPLNGPPERAAAQKAAINDLLDSGSLSTSGIAPCWIEFQKSVWGSGLMSLESLEEVKRDEPVRDFDQPDTVPDKTWVAKIPNALPTPWGSSRQRILIRSEYHEAEQAALLADQGHTDAFLVTGNHGIGKSFFLLWLLMKRLALQLPTAMQIGPDIAFLFYEGGVCHFEHPGDQSCYLSLDSPNFDRIWALVDCDRTSGQPPGIFNLTSTFFVVEAAPPRAPRLECSRKYGTKIFFMKRWTFSEVLQARSFLGDPAPYTEGQLWYLYNEFGASPRDLAHYALTPDVYKAQVVEQVATMNPKALQDALISPYSDYYSDYVVVIEPSAAWRDTPTKMIASRRIFEMLGGEALLPLIPGKLGHDARCWIPHSIPGALAA